MISWIPVFLSVSFRQVINTDPLMVLDIVVVLVALDQRVDEEVDGGDDQVDAEDDSHPLTTYFHKVFRLSPKNNICEVY